MTQDAPSFSVVVPTCGRPAELAICLAALRRLAYPGERLEAIVVVDGPDPAAERAAHEAAGDLALKLVVRPAAGASAARNAGIDRAEGCFVAFTDDDCAPEPGWLTALARAFAATPEDAVGGRTLNGATENLYSTASQAVIDAAHAHWNRGPAGPRFFASNNLAFPLDGIREVGGFNPTFGPAGGEDRDLCDRWLASGRRMREEPEAIVYHLKRLTLSGFLRQHYRYGRGARVFHRARRRGRRNVPEPGFYAELARQGAAHARGARRVRLAGLLAASQAANAAGYFLETPATGVDRPVRRDAAQGRDVVRP